MPFFFKIFFRTWRKRTRKSNIEIYKDRSKITTLIVEIFNFLFFNFCGYIFSRKMEKWVIKILARTLKPTKKVVQISWKWKAILSFTKLCYLFSRNFGPYAKLEETLFPKTSHDINVDVGVQRVFKSNLMKIFGYFLPFNLRHIHFFSWLFEVSFTLD